MIIKVKKLELRISNICSRNCIFCSEYNNRNKRNSFMEFKEIIEIIKSSKIKGINHITFLGGEPTLHPNFPTILKISKKLGFKTQVTTDGSTLSNYYYASKIIPYIDEICLSLHWDSPQLAEKITNNPFAFNETELALKNISKVRSDKTFVMINTVIFAFNFERIEKIIKYGISHFYKMDKYLLSNLIPWGNGINSYSKLSLKMSKIINRLSNISNIFNKYNIPWVIAGIPYCILGKKWWTYSNDLSYSVRSLISKERYNRRNNVLINEYLINSPLNQIKIKKCKKCALKKMCSGVFSEYIKEYGNNEIKPFKNLPLDERTYYEIIRRK